MAENGPSCELATNGRTLVSDMRTFRGHFADILTCGHFADIGCNPLVNIEWDADRRHADMRTFGLFFGHFCNELAFLADI